MKTLLTLFLILPLLLGPTPPNSDDHLHCQVNLNWACVDYTPERWLVPPPGLVTDLRGSARVVDPQGAIDRATQYIHKHAPEIPIGRYVSGARLNNTINMFPPECLTVGVMPGRWLSGPQPPDGRRIVDLENPYARQVFAAYLLEEIERHPKSDIVLLDNIVHPSSCKTWPSWRHTCDLLEMLHRGTTKMGKLLIPNVAVAPWGMPMQDARALAGVADGIALEMVWHKNARGRRDRTLQEIERHRLWLDLEKILIYIAVPRGGGDDEVREREARLIAAFAMMVRKRGDAVFVAWPFHKPKQDWFSWPAEFGEPVGKCRVSKNGWIHRAFWDGDEMRTMTVDPAGRIRINGEWR